MTTRLTSKRTDIGQTRESQLTDEDVEELIRSLTESHDRFIDAIVEGDGALTVLAYANYVRALAIVIDQLPPFE